MQNRRLAELFGICWIDVNNLDDEGICLKCGKAYESHSNPDFAADPRLVLREMMKREDWMYFHESIGCLDPEHRYLDAVLIDYILDQTGLLRDRAVEWLEGK